MKDNVTRFEPRSELLRKEGHYWRVEFSGSKDRQESEISIFSLDRIEVTYVLEVGGTHWERRWSSKLYPKKFSDIDELIPQVETIVEGQVTGFNAFKGGILSKLNNILKKKSKLY